MQSEQVGEDAPAPSESGDDGGADEPPDDTAPADARGSSAPSDQSSDDAPSDAGDDQDAGEPAVDAAPADADDDSGSSDQPSETDTSDAGDDQDADDPAADAAPADADDDSGPSEQASDGDTSDAGDDQDTEDAAADAASADADDHDESDDDDESDADDEQDPDAPAPGIPPVGPDHVAEMDAAWQDALKKKDWATAAQIVNGFNAADLKTRLAALSADDIAKLHQGAIDNHAVGQNSAVALATAAIQNPVLGSAQSARADALAKKLPAEDQKKYQALLDGAKPDKEKQYITKGLAAGHSVAELEAFDKKIAGKDDKWLQDNLSLTGDSNGKGVKQQWHMACNATTVEAVRGQLDPLYALKMHEDNPNLTQADGLDGTKLNPNLAADQKALLETPDATGYKGKANPRDNDPEQKGRWNTDLLNNVKDSTGVSYTNKKIGTDVTLDDGIKSIDDNLAKGAPVPIVIGNADKAYTHYVLITATDPGPPRYYTIHDPWNGETLVRSADQLKTGHLDILNMNQVTAIESPTVVPAK